jgi:[ribosomal protein S18]-alanine N-acetyltransferase
VVSSAIRLRNFQPSDLETLYRIDQKCFPPGIAYGRKEMKFYLQSEGAYCVIAEISDEDREEIAGFILSERSADVAHIITLDVLDRFRRRKIGSILLKSAEREAASQGATRMVLETATTNKPAIALWNKHGYRQFVTIRNYYGRGLDAFELQKPLSRVPEGS